MTICSVCYKLSVATMLIVYMGCYVSLAAGTTQESIIEQFRSTMRDNISASSNLSLWIDDDFYIEQWLKVAGSGGLKRAKELFQQHLSWRQSERIDAIHLEEWSIFSEDYPIFTDTWDKFGRPASEAWYSDWNIRRAIITGQGKKLVRWNVYLQEKMQNRLFETRRLGNKNVTGAANIVDCQGLNVLQQLCIACQAVFIALGEICLTNYRFLWERTYMINMGPAFNSLMKITVPNYKNDGSNNQFKLLHGRNEWMPVLNENYYTNQRSSRFGGTRLRT